jgi:glyoxylase-like metal-dependent hydrolase (beta-lactamase superfamily II)
MEMTFFRVSVYQTNCYMVWGDGSNSCVIVDPGDAPEYLLEQLRLLDKTPAAILITHGHLDHVDAVKAIAEKYACPAYIHEADIEICPEITGGPVYHTHTYADGDTLQFAGLTFQVIHTPGHTPGGVCLLCEDSIFTGDTLFAGTCGRTDFPCGDPQQMQQSLAKLAALPGDYRILPGHSRFTTLEAERNTNPYLQL